MVLPVRVPTCLLADLTNPVLRALPRQRFRAGRRSHFEARCEDRRPLQPMEAPPAQGCPNIRPALTKISRNAIRREESNRPVENPRSGNTVLFS